MRLLDQHYSWLSKYFDAQSISVMFDEDMEHVPLRNVQIDKQLSEMLCIWKENDSESLSAELKMIMDISIRQNNNILLSTDIMTALWRDRTFLFAVSMRFALYPVNVAITISENIPESTFDVMFPKIFDRLDQEMENCTSNPKNCCLWESVVKQLCKKYDNKLNMYNSAPTNVISWEISNNVLRFAKDVGISFNYLQHIYDENASFRPHKKHPAPFVLENFNNPLCALLMYHHRLKFPENFEAAREYLHRTYIESNPDVDPKLLSLWKCALDYPSDHPIGLQLQTWSTLGCVDTLTRSLYHMEDWSCDTLQSLMNGALTKGDIIELSMDSP